SNQDMDDQEHGGHARRDLFGWGCCRASTSAPGSPPASFGSRQSGVGSRHFRGPTRAPLLLFFRFCLGSRLPAGSGRRRIGRRRDRGGAGIQLRLPRHRRRRLGLDGCLLGGLRLLVRLRLRGVRRLGFLDCRRRALLVLLALLVWLALLVLLAVVGVRRLLLL